MLLSPSVCESLASTSAAIVRVAEGVDKSHVSTIPLPDAVLESVEGKA